MTILKKLVTNIVLSSTIALSSIAYAGEDVLILVPLPLDTQQGEITVVDVPFIIGKASPESEFQAIGLPYTPPTISIQEYGDINLASIAGIKVKPSHESGRHYRIELDYAEVKEAYRTEKLLSAVLDCVYKVASRGRGVGYSVKISITNLDSGSELHGILKRLIKIKGEQAGAVQPATAGKPKAADAKAGTTLVIELTAAEFRERIKGPKPEIKPVFIDLSDAKDYAKSHITKARRFDFPADNFEEKIAKLDRNQTYLVYCQNGAKSAKSLAVWKRLKFKKLYYLKGGMKAYLAHISG